MALCRGLAKAALISAVVTGQLPGAAAIPFGFENGRNPGADAPTWHAASQADWFQNCQGWSRQVWMEGAWLHGETPALSFPRFLPTQGKLLPPPPNRLLSLVVLTYNEKASLDSLHRGGQLWKFLVEMMSSKCPFSLAILFCCDFSLETIWESSLRAWSEDENYYPYAGFSEGAQARNFHIPKFSLLITLNTLEL